VRITLPDGATVTSDEGRVDDARMNLIVEADADGFVENDWIGHTLAVGDAVHLPVTVADARCVMISLPQGDLPKDPGIALD
jgi:hypothetical protein